MTPDPFPRFVPPFLALLLAGHLSAETHYIAVDDSGFAPAALNIGTGDTVVWVNYDEFFPHTTTSDLSPLDPDYWQEYLIDFEQAYPKTFNNPGTYTYYDESDPGHKGSIQVSSVQLPVITLEAPRIEAGQFVFDVSGLTAGKTNVLEYTTNLVQWTALNTNVAISGSMTFTNAVSSGMKLFRVIERQ